MPIRACPPARPHPCPCPPPDRTPPGASAPWSPGGDRSGVVVVRDAVVPARHTGVAVRCSRPARRCRPLGSRDRHRVCPCSPAGQLVATEVSSRKKLVASEASSVPRNLIVTVLPL